MFGLIISAEGKVLLNMMVSESMQSRAEQAGGREEQSKRREHSSYGVHPADFLHRPPDATRYTAASGEAHLPRRLAAACH